MWALRTVLISSAGITTEGEMVNIATCDTFGVAI
jgi:hypothetical protein